MDRGSQRLGRCGYLIRVHRVSNRINGYGQFLVNVRSTRGHLVQMSGSTVGASHSQSVSLWGGLGRGGWKWRHLVDRSHEVEQRCVRVSADRYTSRGRV